MYLFFHYTTLSQRIHIHATNNNNENINNLCSKPTFIDTSYSIKYPQFCNYSSPPPHIHALSFPFKCLFFFFLCILKNHHIFVNSTVHSLQFPHINTKLIIIVAYFSCLSNFLIRKKLVITTTVQLL